MVGVIINNVSLPPLTESVIRIKFGDNVFGDDNTWGYNKPHKTKVK